MCLQALRYRRCLEAHSKSWLVRRSVARRYFRAEWMPSASSSTLSAKAMSPSC